MTRRIAAVTGSFWFTLLAALWFLMFIVLPQSLMAADLTIEHVTIVSAERPRPLQDATVRVHDGRIAAVLRGASRAQHAQGVDVIDGTGMFLSPGLIDSHVHLGDIPGMTAEQESEHPDIAAAARRQIPRAYLLSGFTTLVDLVSTPERMAIWTRSSDIVPDTYFCGGAALMDGYSMNYEPKPQRYQDWPYMLIEPGMQSPEGIDPTQHTPEAVVSRMKRDGARCVKTFYERGFGGVSNLPVPKLETVRELVRAAHARGLPVLIHANSDEAQAFAVDAGVDIVAHGLWNWDQQKSLNAAQMVPGIEKILDRELAARVGWQPTLQVLRGIRDLVDPAFLADPRLQRLLPASLIEWYRSPEGGWFLEAASKDSGFPAHAGAAELQRVSAGPFATIIARSTATAHYMIAHQGRVLFGTDTPSAPVYTNPPGLNAQLEMQDLMQAGETPAQIFRSATLVNAQALKLDREVGTVQVGKRANLLLLRRDPTQTIDAYTDIAKVILNGRVLDSGELAANAGH